MTTSSGDTLRDHRPARSLFLTSTSLLAVSIAAQIAYPLVEGTTRDQVTVVVVLASAAAMAVHAAARLGGVRAVAVVAATAGIGWSAEIIGTATSFPFGQYAYAVDRIGPSVADVPIVIGLAWTAGGYCMWWISGLVSSRVPVRIPLATAGLVGWDLYLDPQMVSAGLWTWATQDAGFPGIEQIPVTNFLGWAGVGAVMFTLLAAIDRQPITVSPLTAITPVVWFGWTWLGSALAFLVFLDDPDLPTAVPYGLVVMGVLGVPAALRLLRPAGRRG